MEKIIAGPQGLKEADSKKAAKIISRGGIVAFPTETVYGLAARADKKRPPDKLYSLKQRPQNKPFSVAFADPELAVNKCFCQLIPFGYKLIEKFWPGPLTIVYYQNQEEKIGVRIPSNTIALQVLGKLNFPVFLPSANLSGQKEPVSAEEVEKVFQGQIDLLIDGGRTEHKKASTVVDLTCKPFKILREGAITEDDIASVFVKKRILFVCTGNSCRSPMAEYLLREYLRKTKGVLFQRYEIISAGISAPEGMRPTEEIRELMGKKEGIDISDSRAAQVTKQMVLSSDYIFTMEDFQLRYVLDQVPSARARVFNLGKVLTPSLDSIPDPIGKSFIFYQNIYDLIKKAVSELVNWL